MATDTKTQVHEVVHVEIPATDTAKLCSFYEAVFGWKFSAAPGMDNYMMGSTTGDMSGTGLAIFPKMEGARPTNYFDVEDVGTYANKIEKQGGKVIHRFTVKGMGYGAVCLDPEENVVGLWHGDSAATE